MVIGIPLLSRSRGHYPQNGKPPENAALLDGSRTSRDGLRIAGISGIIGDPKRSNRRTAEDFGLTVEPLAEERPDILVLHQGPDRRQHPDPTVANALARGRNLFVICGHSPWPDPLLEWGEGCQAINVDGRVVVLEAG